MLNVVVAQFHLQEEMNIKALSIYLSHCQQMPWKDPNHQGLRLTAIQFLYAVCGTQPRAH